MGFHTSDSVILMPPNSLANSDRGRLWAATDHDFVIHPCPFLEGRRDTQDFSARGSWGLQPPVGGAWRCQCPGTPSLQPWGATVSRQEATAGVAPAAGPGGRPRGCVHRPAHQPGRQWTAASLAFILLLGWGCDLPACRGTVHLGGLSHFSTRGLRPGSFGSPVAGCALLGLGPRHSSCLPMGR